MSKTMKWRGCFVSGLCLLALVACENKKTESKAVDQAASKTEAQTANPAGPIQGKAKEVLQGGGFTMTGISETVPDFRIMAIPFLFRSYAEVDRLAEALEARASESRPDRGVVTVETRATNQRSETVMKFKRSVLVLGTPGLPANLTKEKNLLILRLLIWPLFGMMIISVTWIKAINIL